MENPFIFGDVVKDEHFTDREEELRTLTLDLSGGQNVLLFSPRRYGKTSLIIRVMEELKAKGLICVYVDLFRASSLQSLGKIYAAAVTQATASKLEEAAQFIRDNFPIIRPKVIVKGPTDTEFELDFEAPAHDVERWLDEIYDLPQRIAERKKKKLVVVFDEFQEIAALGPPGTVERGLRSKIQHHDRVAYVFMGSKRHLLDELFTDKSRPLYHIAKPIPLGKIPKEKLADFIRSRFESSGMKISTAQTDRILEITECHSYYTQQLSHEVYNAAFPRPEVSDGDIARAQDNCIQAQAHGHVVLWDGLAGKQRELVIALAKSGMSTIYSQEFIDRHSLGSTASVQTAAEALEKKGLLDRENGSYGLSDVFFAEWVRRKIA